MKQIWDPHRYATHARFVSELGEPVLDLLAPQPGERILDLGCGDGALTQKLAEERCDVVGIDSSSKQVEAARERGLDARVMDGQFILFDQEFDAVFSNAALHWLRQGDRVLAGVWRSLKDQGRFVAEFGGEGNVKNIVTALDKALARRGIESSAWNPWFFPNVTHYSEMLDAHGFIPDYIELIPRPTPLPGDIVDWLKVFAQSFLAAVPETQRGSLLQEVRETLRPLIFDEEQKVWVVDYMRLRFRATKLTDSCPSSQL
ncbi:MAG: methyltransferase domain-containing protein [Gammaproteobacteria bacterium]|nr:methyltransferase domain-containing protein [Gammaproteobacteria bacterium]